jgi:hypothetical protein
VSTREQEIRHILSAGFSARYAASNLMRPLKELDRALVFLRALASIEGPEIPAAAGFWIQLARI